MPDEIKAIENPFDQVSAAIQFLEGLSGEETVSLRAHVRGIAGLFLDLDDETDLLDRAEAIQWGRPSEYSDTDE